METKCKELVNLIFEAAVVKRMLRTGWQVLGDNTEDVGSHSFMTAVIAYFLAREMKQTSQNINMEKVLMMSIFHDFHESRTGDMDKIATLYMKRDQAKANEDIFGKSDHDLFGLLEEYEKRESTEAKLVYEANILALLVELKALQEKGNVNVAEWLDANSKRIKLPEAQALAKGIIDGNTQDWWQDIRDSLHKKFTE